MNNNLLQNRTKIECEDDLQSWMERGMESNGWTALREVTARHSDCRADIVAKKDGIATVGIECKYVTGGPVVAAEAARQIFNKYSSEKFFQWDIDIWGVCLFGREFRPMSMKMDKEDYDKDRSYHVSKTTDRVKSFTIQRMLNGLGVGMIDPSHDLVCMEFAPNNPECRIPLFAVDGGFKDSYIKTDLDRIRGMIEERRPV